MKKNIQKDKTRCFGNGADQALYADYHDHEWGIPVHEDQKLFEMLILEGAQAGLSWETVLKKREGYRQLFHHFEPKLAASMTDDELEKLINNPAIIRNRRKIFSVRQNARVFIKIQEAFGSFDRYLWEFVDNKPLFNQWEHLKQIPSKTSISDAISKDLKNRGMSFVGSTIIYAFMQAVGLVDDHLVSCWRRTHARVLKK